MPVSTSYFVDYSALLPTPMPICTLYVGLARMGTSVGGTLSRAL